MPTMREMMERDLGDWLRIQTGDHIEEPEAFLIWLRSRGWTRQEPEESLCCFACSNVQGECICSELGNDTPELHAPEDSIEQELTALGPEPDTDDYHEAIRTIRLLEQNVRDARQEAGALRSQIQRLEQERDALGEQYYDADAKLVIATNKIRMIREAVEWEKAESDRKRKVEKDQIRLSAYQGIGFATRRLLTEIDRITEGEL